MAAEANSGQDLRYQADEKPPLPLTVGIGANYALLSLAGVVLTPTLAFRAAGASEGTVVWATFASLVICGFFVMLRARPPGLLGMGYVLGVGTSKAAIGVTVDALKAGGPALLAVLAMTTSLFQFAFARHLSLLRRMLTPTVCGTALMLVPVTVAPVLFGLFDDTPPGHPATAAPAAAGVTFAVVGGLRLFGTPRCRPWALLAGIVSGALVAAFHGLYDIDGVRHAAWFGVPSELPGQLAPFASDLDFEGFVSAAPGFVLLYLVLAVRSTSSSLAIQAVSWRDRRAMDYRPVQAAITSDSLATLAAGVAGTMPITTKTKTVGHSMLTGVASRSTAMPFGMTLILVALCPKALALVLAIPSAVFAASAMLSLTIKFVTGFNMAVSEGTDRRQTMIIGLSFWMGVGCQYGFLFPDFVGTFANGMLENALASGGLLAILLHGLVTLTAPRRQRLETRLAVASIPQLSEFVRGLAQRHHWSPAMADRLDAVAEEALLTLQQDDRGAEAPSRRLLILASKEGDSAVLEFIAAGGRDNIEDRLALLGESVGEESIERDVSLRLLRRFTSKVQHRQYHDVDVLTVQVQPPNDAFNRSP